MIGIFEKTISATILILFVIIIRSLLLHKLPKITFYIMWAVVVLHLLLPFSVQLPHIFPDISELEIFADNKKTEDKNEKPEDKKLYEKFKYVYWKSFAEMGQSITDVKQSIVINNNVQINDKIGLDNYDDSTVFSNNVSDISTGAGKLEKSKVLKIIWFAGCILFFLYFLGMHIYCRIRYAEAIPLDNSLLPVHFIRKVNVRVSDRILSPLTYGMISPIILLPKIMDFTDKKQLRVVLEHETIHILRFDIVYKWIMTISVCLYWFNPFVWIMYILANRDIELSCDEAVIRRFEKDYKTEYALALLNFEERRNHLLLFEKFSGNAIKERIDAIIKLKKLSAKNTIFAVFIVIATVTIFVAARQKETPLGTLSPENNVKEEEKNNYFNKMSNSVDFGWFAEGVLADGERNIYTCIGDTKGTEGVVAVPNDIDYFAVYEGKFYYVNTRVGAETGEIAEEKFKIISCEMNDYFKDSELLENALKNDLIEKNELLVLENIQYIVNCNIQQGVLYCYYVTLEGEEKIAAIDLKTNEIHTAVLPEEEGKFYIVAGIDREYVYYMEEAYKEKSYTTPLYQYSYNGKDKTLLYEFEQRPELISLIEDNFYVVYNENEELVVLSFNKFGKNVREFKGFIPKENSFVYLLKQQEYIYLSYNDFIYQFDEKIGNWKLFGDFRKSVGIENVRLEKISSDGSILYFFSDYPYIVRHGTTDNTALRYFSTEDNESTIIFKWYQP